ncbi:hypothetical protein KAT63_04545 [Candidatus Parcubacteria bacterium]|nr:hypothetical protein [Candidatus Parcubacteria bacterium]
MVEIKKRRNLRKKVEVEEAERKKAETKPVQKLEEVNLEISHAKDILFQFSFYSSALLPRGLRIEKSDTEGYSGRREKEKENILEMGIKPEVQRSSAVPDTGYSMGRYEKCEGGETVFFALLNSGWKVVDSHYKVKEESQESIESGKGRKKNQVFISLSKEGEEANLDDITCRDILRLMRMVWAGNLWDNTHLPQENVVLNFPKLHKKGTTPEQVFVLKQT